MKLGVTTNVEQEGCQHNIEVDINGKFVAISVDGDEVFRQYTGFWRINYGGRILTYDDGDIELDA